MGTAIDNFTEMLHDNLEALEDQAKSLRKSLKSASKKTQSEIQSNLNEVKMKLDTKKHEIDDYRAKLQVQFEEKEAEVQAHVEEWKASGEVNKLKFRADRAEDYAGTVAFLAKTMIEQAEEATLSAIAARRDAEAAAEYGKK
jgi:uncharacterized protein (DUF342 family)